MFGLPVVVFVKKSLCVCGVHFCALILPDFVVTLHADITGTRLPLFFCLFLFVLRFFAALFFLSLFCRSLWQMLEKPNIHTKIFRIVGSFFCLVCLSLCLSKNPFCRYFVCRHYRDSLAAFFSFVFVCSSLFCGFVFSVAF